MLTRRFFLSSAAAASAAAVLPASAFAKAPLMGASPAMVMRYKIGGMDLSAIADGGVTFPKPWEIFGEDQNPVAVRQLAAAQNLPIDKQTITFTPCVVNTGNELVLFDTGWGSGNPGRGLMSDSLKAAGYTLDQIDVVVLTHYHPDHMGGLMDGDKPVFPNARYVFPEADHNYWTNAKQDAGATKDFYALTKAKVVPLAEKASFIKNGGEVVKGITALSTPGHTPGHTSYHLESEGQRLLITGDICNHFVLSLQRPKWHVNFDMDKETATKTRLQTLDMVCTDRLPVMAFHFPFPCVGFIHKERSAEPSYYWHTAAYAFNG